MADYNATVGFEVEGDGLSQASSQMKNLASSTKEATTATEDFNRSQAMAESRAKTLESISRRSSIALDDVKRRVSAAENEFSKAATSTSMFEKAMSGVGSVLGSIGGGIASLGGSIGGLLSGFGGLGGAARSATSELHGFHVKGSEVYHGMHALELALRGTGVELRGIGGYARLARGGIELLGIAAVGGAIVGLEALADKARFLELRLKSLLGEKAGAKAFEDLEHAADKAGLSVEALAPSFEKLAVSMQTALRARGLIFAPDSDWAARIGLGTKGLAEAMATLAKAAELTGAAGEQATKGIGTFLTTISDKGKLTLEEFNKLMFQFPGAAEMLAKGFLGPNATIIQFQRTLQLAGAQGKSLLDVLMALSRVKPMVDEKSLTVDKSIAQAWSDLKAAVESLWTTLGKLAGLNVVSQALEGLANIIREVTEALQHGGIEEGWNKFVELAANAYEKVKAKIIEFFSRADVQAGLSKFASDLSAAAEATIIPAASALGSKIVEAILSGIAAGAAGGVGGANPFSTLLGWLERQVDLLIADLRNYLIEKMGATLYGWTFGQFEKLGPPTRGAPSFDEAGFAGVDWGAGGAGGVGATGGAAGKGAALKSATDAVDTALTGAADAAKEAAPALGELGTSLTKLVTPADDLGPSLDDLSTSLADAAKPAADIAEPMGKLAASLGEAVTPTKGVADALPPVTTAMQELGPAATQTASALASAVQQILAAAAQASAGAGGGDQGIVAPNMGADIGTAQRGGVFTIPGGSTGPDSVPLHGMVTPGEIVAVIPPGKADKALLTSLQDAIGSSPIMVGPTGPGGSTSISTLSPPSEKGMGFAQGGVLTTYTPTDTSSTDIFASGKGVPAAGTVLGPVGHGIYAVADGRGGAKLVSAGVTISDATKAFEKDWGTSPDLSKGGGGGMGGGAGGFVPEPGVDMPAGAVSRAATDRAAAAGQREVWPGFSGREAEGVAAGATPFGEARPIGGPSWPVSYGDTGLPSEPRVGSEAAPLGLLGDISGAAPPAGGEAAAQAIKAADELAAARTAEAIATETAATGEPAPLPDLAAPPDVTDAAASAMDQALQDYYQQNQDAILAGYADAMDFINSDAANQAAMDAGYGSAADYFAAASGDYYDPYAAGGDYGGYYDPYASGGDYGGYGGSDYSGGYYDPYASGGDYGGSYGYDAYASGSDYGGYDTGSRKGNVFFAGGFQAGGSFKVPNDTAGGGTDPILTMLRTSPGERIDVTPAGKTAEQASTFFGGSGGNIATKSYAPTPGGGGGDIATKSYAPTPGGSPGGGTDFFRSPGGGTPSGGGGGGYGSWAHSGWSYMAPEGGFGPVLGAAINGFITNLISRAGGGGGGTAGAGDLFHIPTGGVPPAPTPPAPMPSQDINKPQHSAAGVTIGTINIQTPDVQSFASPVSRAAMRRAITNSLSNYG